MAPFPNARCSHPLNLDPRPLFDNRDKGGFQETDTIGPLSLSVGSRNMGMFARLIKPRRKPHIPRSGKLDICLTAGCFTPLFRRGYPVPVSCACLLLPVCHLYRALVAYGHIIFGCLDYRLALALDECCVPPTVASLSGRLRDLGHHLPVLSVRFVCPGMLLSGTGTDTKPLPASQCSLMAGVPGTAKDVKEHSSRDDVLGHATIEPESLTDEHGRTYQAYRPGKYFFPNDALEQDRLDTQHSMFTLALEGLHLAPIDKPPFVLDLCTGTGVWAREFAEDHPESAVLGIDLSSIQPRDNAPNCYFMKHDAEDPWPFGPSDYIHLRGTVACFEDTMSVIASCFQNLRPGGYVEFQDLLYDARSEDGTHEGTHL